MNRHRVEFTAFVVWRWHFQMLNQRIRCYLIGIGMSNIGRLPSLVQTNSFFAVGNHRERQHLPDEVLQKSHPPSGQAHRLGFHSREVWCWEVRPRIGRVDRVCQTLTLLGNFSRAGRDLETRSRLPTFNFLHLQTASQVCLRIRFGIRIRHPPYVQTYQLSTPEYWYS